MNIKKIVVEASKISVSAVIGHQFGKLARENVLKDPRVQVYKVEGDTIFFNRRPDGVNSIRSTVDLTVSANNAYAETAIVMGLGSYVGLSKLEEVVTDRLEKKRMKRLTEMASEEPTSEAPVTEEVTEE